MSGRGERPPCAGAVCSVLHTHNAMPTEMLHRRIPIRLNMILNDTPYPLIQRARLAVVNRRLPAVIRHLYQLPARFVDLTNADRLGAVPVIAANICRDVDVDDVAVL